MGLSNDLSHEAGSLSCCCPNPHGRFQSEVWGFISLRWSPGLRCLLLSLPSVWFIYALMWGRRVLPTALPAPLSTTLSPALSVYLCKCRVAGSASARTACPRSSNTPPVSVPLRPRESSPPRCPSPPLLPVWMNVYFVFPWCWTPLPFDFLSVLVVRGGAVCLPTPPSWFSQKNKI